MPSTPATPRRSSNNRRSAPSTPKGSDHPPSDLYSPSSVADRIRRWQDQDASAAVPTPTGSDVSLPLNLNRNVEKEPKKLRQSFADKDNDRPKLSDTRRRRSKHADPKSKEWVREVRSSSTPRKRVISDEHWKKMKADEQALSGSTTPRDDTRKDSPYDDLSRNRSSAFEERQARRARRRELRQSSKQCKTRESGIKSDLDAPCLSRRPTAESESPPDDEMEARSNVDYDLAWRLGGSPTPSESRTQPFTDGIPVETDDGRSRRRSRYADALGGPLGTSDPPPKTKVRMGSIFNQAKVMFTRSEPVVVASPRVPSIEAWLMEQPDPFVETSTPPPVEVPALLKRKSRRREPVPDAIMLEDPNQIWSALEPERPEQPRSSERHRHRRRRTRTSDDNKSPDNVTNPDPSAVRTADAAPQYELKCPDVSTATRKRRGARSSNTRDRSSLPVSPALETSHTPSAKDRVHAAASPVYEPDQQEAIAKAKTSKPCPPTGKHALSTIASIETFNTRLDPAEDAIMPPENNRGLKRRLTTHEDLMSVLSLPRAEKNTRSSRSTRRNVGNTSLVTLMDDFVVDEARYMRELQTLVDGVIPVLLQSVLSKSGSAAAAGLFTSSTNARDDLNFTKPIIDMGVALERLKTTHSRAPTKDPEVLLTWAQGAHKIYAEYLKAWRLGFQGVVVNLAPATNPPDKESSQGMARDADGDVVNADGKKVDVAYLLKRPLVRIKNLNKMLDCVKDLKPSPKAMQAASDYTRLEAAARKRVTEEQGRLEDEVAANIDSTKARNPRTLGVLTGTKVDKSRRVTAKDEFHLALHHSTGQKVDCQVELVMRSNPPGNVRGGDLLVCEVDTSGKWLLLPPIETAFVSARLHESTDSLVVMIRGSHEQSGDWYELLHLTGSHPQAAQEWLQMLGSRPCPPNLNMTQSILAQQTADVSAVPSHGLSSASLRRLPGSQDIDVPIGEASVLGTSTQERPRSAQEQPPYPHSIGSSNASRVNLSEHSSSSTSSSKLLQREPVASGAKLSLGGQLARPKAVSPTRFNGLRSAPELSCARVSKSPTVEMKDDPHHKPVLATASPAAKSPPTLGAWRLNRTDKASREWMETPAVARYVSPQTAERKVDLERESPVDEQPKRPGYKRAPSSTPSKELPTIPRLRPTHPATPPTSTPLTESIRDQWNAITGSGKKAKAPHERQPHSAPSTPRAVRPRSERGLPYTEDVPTPPIYVGRSDSSPQLLREQKPVPPPHRQPSSQQMQVATPEALTPQEKQTPTPNTLSKRRSSSPLKHEYAPSTGTASPGDYDTDESSSSESDASDDELPEQNDKSTPLLTITGNARKTSRPMPPISFPSRATTTLAPSDSASQGPYRSVPAASSMPNAKTFKAMAAVCYWAGNEWLPLHNELDCAVIVSAGLIEAYQISEAHSNDFSGIDPLVGFELTPMVPLRKGTGLDISIRSPPTERSRIKTSHNVMFRSRHGEECEQLYAMINWARINNPTYIALSNARPSYQPPVSFNTQGARHSSQGARSKSGSWFGFGSQGKRSSYRASSAPESPSVGGDSASSVTSALSALRRFSGGGAFNLKRSSVLRNESRARSGGSIYSSSTITTGTGSGSASPAPSQFGGTAMVNDLKIVFHRREKLQWSHLGSAKLNVLPAPDLAAMTNTIPGSPAAPNNTPGSNASTPRGPRLPSSSHTPHRVHGNGREKRILVTGLKKGEIMLDAVLGESCFERIGLRGIALSVWIEDAEIKKSGGVMSGRDTTYMLQCKSEAEASWVFGLVGRLRY